MNVWAMNWLRRMFGTVTRLPMEPSPTLASLRCVVVDVESTGLDPLNDRLISIGAVSVEGGTVRLGSGFEVVLCQPQASSHANILIHGIDGTTQMAGIDPAAALTRFLDYAERAPLVGFHTDFDRALINRAATRALGRAPSLVWLDLAYLAPALLAGPGMAVPQGLDAWLQQFGIENHARHNALADALATAQLLQVVLARAIATGVTTLAGLQRIESDQRWLSRR